MEAYKLSDHTLAEGSCISPGQIRKEMGWIAGNSSSSAIPERRRNSEIFLPFKKHCMERFARHSREPRLCRIPHKYVRYLKVGERAVSGLTNSLARPLQGRHAEITYHFRCAQCRRNVQNLIFETLASFFTQIRIAANEMYCF